MNGATSPRKVAALVVGVVLLVALIATSPGVAQAAATSDPAASTARVAGVDRYATAAAVARQQWATAPTVVVANGETNGIDAVPASYLAGVEEAPVLLTRAASVPTDTADAIAALDPRQVVVVGGEASVSPATYDALTAGRTGRRLAGADRFETAAAIARGPTTRTAPSTVFIARGDLYGDQVNGDALAATPVAYRARAPVLLTGANNLPVATAQALTALRPTSVVVLGTDDSVSAQVADEVETASGVDSVTRLAGADPAGTAAALADSGIVASAGFSRTGVAIANGSRVDALAAGPAAGRAGFPLLLAESAGSLGPATLNYLQVNEATLTDTRVYGDTGAVSDTAARSSALPGADANPASASSVVALAEAFAATLTDDQQKALQQEYTFANVSNWSDLPDAQLAATRSAGRVGLQTGSLSQAQWGALEALLRATTGSGRNEGFEEVVQHLDADDRLSADGGGTDYGRGHFSIAFLGRPSDTGPWELQFGGHHLAVANTYRDGVLVAATPSLRGIDLRSSVGEDGMTGPEQQARSALAAVLASLDGSRKSSAHVPTSFTDVVLGPGADWAFPATPVGVKGSDLVEVQQEFLLGAINTYVDDVADADAASILARYRGELDDTYVAFSGTGSMTEAGDYVRIDGPSVWIEMSVQEGSGVQGQHLHAVWRDERTDYAGLSAGAVGPPAR